MNRSRNLAGMTRYQWFESGFLQRGVTCELVLVGSCKRLGDGPGFLRDRQFESGSLQRGVMQTIGSALGDEVSVSEIGVGSSFDADSHLSRGAD
jgi:hypothetical protein